MNEVKKLRYMNNQLQFFMNRTSFLAVMKPFLSYAEKKLSDVTVALEASITSFQSVVDYFGDDQKLTTPNSFFSNIVSFAHAFQRSHHISIEKKLRIESLKLKESKRLQQRTEKSLQEIDNLVWAERSLQEIDKFVWSEKSTQEIEKIIW